MYPVCGSKQPESKRLSPQASIKFSPYFEANHLRIQAACPRCHAQCVGNASQVELWSASHVCTSDSKVASDGLYTRLQNDIRLPELLKAALEGSGAHAANIQLFDGATGALKIVAQRGFDDHFLQFFHEVRTTESACGAAMANGERVVVSDVANSELFCGKESGRVMLRAGSLAVQSTPIFTSAGGFVGMISTHYARQHHFPKTELKYLDQLVSRFAREVRV